MTYCIDLKMKVLGKNQGHLVFIVCVALVDKELVERKTEAETEEFEQKWIFLSPIVSLMLIVDFCLNMNTTFIINATTKIFYWGTNCCC